MIVTVPIGEATLSGETPSIDTGATVILGEKVYFGYPKLRYEGEVT